MPGYFLQAMNISPISAIDDATKLRFAREYLRTKKWAEAALNVIGDPGTALRAAQVLPSDPIVIAEIERLVGENGEDSFLPTKAEIAREIYDKAKQFGDSPEDYERLMKLYCTIRGYIEKPGANVGVAVTVAPVMVLRDHGTDEEWAAKAAAQQHNLVLNAAN